MTGDHLPPGWDQALGDTLSQMMLDENSPRGHPDRIGLVYTYRQHGQTKHDRLTTTEIAELGPSGIRNLLQRWDAYLIASYLIDEYKDDEGRPVRNMFGEVAIRQDSDILVYHVATAPGMPELEHGELDFQMMGIDGMRPEWEESRARLMRECTWGFPDVRILRDLLPGTVAATPRPSAN